MSLSVSIDGLEETLTNLATMPTKIKSEARKNLNKAATTGARVAKRKFDRKTSPYGTHGGEQIIDTKPATRSMEATVNAGRGKTIKDGFNYLLSVEFGASGFDGKPPVKRFTGKEESLDRWVKRMSPTPRTKEQLKLTQEELNEEVAFLISSHIKEFGLEEKPFMRPGFGQATAKLKKEMKEFETKSFTL